MFILRELLSAVLQPGNFLMLCLLAGVILQFLSRGRRGKVLVGLSALGFALVAVAPIGPAIMLPLEERFPLPAKLPERIDGILVLGGAVTPPFSWSSGVTAFNCSTVRLLGAVALAHRHPEAKLVLVGKGLFPVGYSNTRATLGFVTKEGIVPTRILAEEQSRSTRENAVNAKELLRPAPGETWVLITSAYHMPRAVGAFTAIGWQVTPYPVDFSIDPRTEMRASFNLVGGLHDSTLAAHEWVGLVVYRLMGWTRELFPAPTTQASPG
jgi:uncharacterized SAM-binding protein YcdF (DUF218 family)